MDKFNIQAGHFQRDTSVHSISSLFCLCIRQMSLMRRLFHSPQFIAALVRVFFFHFIPFILPTPSFWRAIDVVLCSHRDVCRTDAWIVLERTDVIQYNILIVYGRNYRHQEMFIKSCLTYFIRPLILRSLIAAWCVHRHTEYLKSADAHRTLKLILLMWVSEYMYDMSLSMRMRHAADSLWYTHRERERERLNWIFDCMNSFMTWWKKEI